MFGGFGIMRGGMMIAVGTGETLYLKADDTTSPAFETEGAPQWVYERKKVPTPMPYWQAPDRLFDDPDEFVVWAERAFEVARARKAAKVKPSRKSPAKKQAAAPKARARKPATARKPQPAKKKPASTKKPAAKKRTSTKTPKR